MASLRSVPTLLLVSLLLVGAGCVGTRVRSPAGTTPGDQTTTASTGSPTRVPTEAITHPGFDAYAFDHWNGSGPVVAGGIRSPADGSGPKRFSVALVTSAAGRSDFDESALDADARRFVDRTNFSRSSLVVFQASTMSSVPDYRVEGIRRDGDGLHVAVDRSSRIRTADVTVETLLVRVDRHGRSVPTAVTVTTATGVSVSSGTGVRTVTPAPTTTPDRVTLPYASPNASENVAEPRALRVVNRGPHTNGFRVTVTATETPACRQSTPPCMLPSRRVTLISRTGKLRSGGSMAFRDLVAKRGSYAVAVEADVPSGDGGRRTVSRSFEWRVGVDGVGGGGSGVSGNATVVLTDGGVRVAADAGTG